MSRRKYSPEYKQEAVLLVKQSDVSISEVVRSLGINDNMLSAGSKRLARRVRQRFPVMAIRETKS